MKQAIGFSAFLLSLMISCAGSTPKSQAPRKLGEPSDDVDPAMIGFAVRENPGRFQNCYERARERNPSLEGLIEIRFLINSDGSIGQAEAVETNLPATVVDCVVAAFYDLKLPEQKDGAVVAQYPMLFHPADSANLGM